MNDVIYVIGVTILFTGGIALALCAIGFILALGVEFLWKRYKEAHTFIQLRKAWVYWQEHNEGKAMEGEKK